jgi:hypothetical protein
LLRNVVHQDASVLYFSSFSADVSKFIKKAYDHLEENKTFHLYQDFLLDADLFATPWELANKIDSLIGQAFQCAAKTCAKTSKYV